MRTTWRRMITVVCLTAVVSVAGLAGDAPAGVEAAGSPAKTQAEAGAVPQTILEKVFASGTIGYLLIVLGFIALAISIREYRTLHDAHRTPRQLYSLLEGQLEEEELDEACRSCQDDDSLLARVLEAGLARHEFGFDAMELACEEALQQEYDALMRRVSLLGLLSGTAPMLGLLGTVSGMIDAFGQIALIQNPNPQLLAGGIMLALMTTLLGLLVAIPSTAIHFYLKGHVQKLVLDTQEAVSSLLDFVRPVGA